MPAKVTCRAIYPGRVEGEALVCPGTFPLSGVTFDLSNGKIAWPGHPLDGQSVKDKILVLSKIEAFAGGDWALLALCTFYGTGPRAILCSELPPMLAAGAILAKLVTITDLPAVLLNSLRSGDYLRIDTQAADISVGVSSTDAMLGAKHQLDFRRAERIVIGREAAEILDGRQGEAMKECLASLVSYGEALGATRLIPIESVHVAGAGYNTTGEVAIRFLTKLAAGGLKARVPATLNPIAVDLERWESVLNFPRHLYDKQRELNDAFKALGFLPLYSCKPYWTGHVPPRGTNFVSSEHSVSIYANSVIGARTNFESNIVSIIAAFVGLIPYYGLYRPENRLPTVTIRVDASIEDPVDWRCLGVLAARRSKGRIPFFRGFRYNPNERLLRDLSSAFGPPWTSVAMLHVHQVTPESALAYEAAANCDETVISTSDLREVREEFAVPTAEPIDLVALGCPQASIEEIQEVVSKLEGRRISDKSRLWIWTDASTRADAESRGYVRALKLAGGEIISDTCGCAACPISRSGHSIRHLATDSTKTCGFIPRSGITTHLGSVQQCLEAAVSGYWRRTEAGCPGTSVQD